MTTTIQQTPSADFTSNFMPDSNALPIGFTARPPTNADAQLVTDLINSEDLRLMGTNTTTVDEIETEWQMSSFNLTQGALLVFAPDGALAGYETMQDEDGNGKLNADGYVHVRDMGKGVGSYMLNWAMLRAQELAKQYDADQHVIVRGTCFHHDQPAVDLYQSFGFHHVRSYYRMEIQLTHDQPVIPPPLPEGITLRTFVPNQDEQNVYEMVVEAFKDHWGWTALPFEDWKLWHFGRSGFDPSLWHLAVDTSTNQLAGVSLTRVREEDGGGWLGSLGVLRPYRKQGLGMMLLQHTFAEFQQRGRLNVALGVDATSLTGATRLYERAGMHIATQFDTFERKIVR